MCAGLVREKRVGQGKAEVGMVEEGRGVKRRVGEESSL